MKTYITIGMLALLAALAGCDTGRLIVKERPPETIYEKPAPPAPNYIWTGPGYAVSDGKYEYRSGLWVSPPNSNRRWIEGRWKETKQGWVWINGYWSSRR